MNKLEKQYRDLLRLRLEVSARQYVQDLKAYSLASGRPPINDNVLGGK